MEKEQKNETSLFTEMLILIDLILLNCVAISYYFIFKLQEFWDLKLRYTTIRDSWFFLNFIIFYFLINITFYFIIKVYGLIKFKLNKEEYEDFIDSAKLTLFMVSALSFIMGMIIGIILGIMLSFFYSFSIIFFILWGMVIGLIIGSVAGLILSFKENNI
ncbi:MAG: hypothetical protein WCO35_01090 [Candidatus Nomurabacteria bacterium]